MDFSSPYPGLLGFFSTGFWGVQSFRPVILNSSKEEIWKLIYYEDFPLNSVDILCCLAFCGVLLLFWGMGFAYFLANKNLLGFTLCLYQYDISSSDIEHKRLGPCIYKINVSCWYCTAIPALIFRWLGIENLLIYCCALELLCQLSRLELGQT